MSRRQTEAGILVAVIVLLLLIVVPAIQSARHASQRVQSRNNLKNLWLALHNYCDMHNALPPGGSFHVDGRPHHGWMTSILPYMDASPVYNWINFEQPWDAAANAGIFLEPHLCYQSPCVPMSVGAWEYYPAHYSANSHLLGPNSCVKLVDIPAKSSMMLAGEMHSDFVPWGCPFNDRPLESVNHQDAYGRPDRNGWLVLLADGNVRDLSSNIAPELLHSLSGPNLAITDKGPIKMQRPNHFTVPADALMRHLNSTGNGKWRIDFVDKNGRVVSSEEGRWNVEP